MIDVEKAIIITNNDKVRDAYCDILRVIMMDDYMSVLIKTRDMVHAGYRLLTHPQASSLKPNQTPYRSVIVYPGCGEDNSKNVILIEKCIAVFEEWQSIAHSPARYSEKVDNDFKTIDLSIIENVVSRIN